MSRLITMASAYQALVSDEDHEWLIGHKWCNVNGYAWNKKLGMMHRAIMHPNQPHTILVVDHINRIKNDNRRCNLRIVPVVVNVQNRSRHQGSPANIHHSIIRQMIREEYPHPYPKDFRKCTPEVQQAIMACRKEIADRERIANTDMLFQLMLSDAEQRQFSNYSL